MNRPTPALEQPPRRPLSLLVARHRRSRSRRPLMPARPGNAGLDPRVAGHPLVAKPRCSRAQSWTGESWSSSCRRRTRVSRDSSATKGITWRRPSAPSSEPRGHDRVHARKRSPARPRPCFVETHRSDGLRGTWAIVSPQREPRGGDEMEVATPTALAPEAALRALEAVGHVEQLQALDDLWTGYTSQAELPSRLTVTTSRY